MSTERPRRRFQDIIDNAASIRKYTSGLDFDAYRTSDIVVDAVERCLSRISESAVKLGPQAERLAPDVDWKSIRGLGNILRHAYDGVATETIWEIVTVDLDVLAAACTTALKTLPPDTA